MHLIALADEVVMTPEVVFWSLYQLTLAKIIFPISVQYDNIILCCQLVSHKTKQTKLLLC
jgi:hypothetical protein